MDCLLKILALSCCVIVAAAQSSPSDQVPTIRNVVVEVGEQVRLRCPPNADSANISWYKNDVPLISTRNRVRVLQEWVRFRDVNLSDTRIYRCKIVSGRNVGWRNVSVTVQSPVGNAPRNQSKPRDINLGARTTEKKTRALHSNLDSDTVHRTQAEVNTKQRNKRETLSAPRFTKPDRMHIDDKVDETQVGVHNKTAELSIPSFTKPNQMHNNIAKPAGSMLRLRCLSDGNPTPNITWFKNNEPPARMLGITKKRAWALSIEDLVPEDGGNYTCIVCNTQGCIGHTFKVDVIERFPHKPYINPGFLKNVTVQVNGTAKFECTIVSDLEPRIEWIRTSECPGKDVEKPEGKLIQAAGDPSVVRPDELQLYNVTHEDEGWYTCIAGNLLGTTFSSAYLRVVDRLGEDQPKLVNMTVSIKFNVSCAGQICDFAALGSFQALPRP